VPQVDVDYGPAVELVGELQAQPVDAVVRPGHPDDLGAERLGLGDLGGLEVGRHEHNGLEPVRGCRPRHGAGQIAGRGAGEGVEAELLRARGCHCDNPILEGERGIA
jgi:hypothetical protein